MIRRLRVALAALAVIIMVFGAVLVFGKPSVDFDVQPASYPATIPAQICDSSVLGGGPTTAPAGAITVPAGNNVTVDFNDPNTTYWFAPGVHTFDTDPYSQIIPGNGSTFIGAPGAVIDGQNANRYAFTQQAANVTIKYLTIKNFTPPSQEAAVNHDSGPGWTMQYLTIEENGGAGVMLGTDNTISYSCLRNNGQYGFSTYLPTLGALNNITLDHNEIVGNNQDDWESQIDGCGCTGGGKFWDSHNVTVTNNYVHDNLSVGLWADGNNYNFTFEGNWIENNDAEGIFFETGYNAVIKNNVLKGNNIVSGLERQAANNKFPIAAIYVSEAGYDSRVAAPTGSSDFRIEGNLIENNWGGVVLWENADRYCNSPANTTTGHCTLVNPNITHAQCVEGTIETEPAYSDCRWKTQNVRVTGNEFVFDPAAVNNCTVGICGQTGVLSNWGTFPEWSPYMGDTIQQAITFNQNNVWDNNAYTGPWVFTAEETAGFKQFADWQAAPYNQDAGSTYAGPAPVLPEDPGPDPDPEPNPGEAEPVAGLDFEIGPHTPWYSAEVNHVLGGAHGGSGSLKFTTVDPWGSAVQLDNWPGYEAVEDSYDFSLYYKSDIGTVNWNIRWKDSTGVVIRTDIVPLASAVDWTAGGATQVAPVGTTHVDWTFTWSASAAGQAIQIDDLSVVPSA